MSTVHSKLGNPRQARARAKSSAAYYSCVIAVTALALFPFYWMTVSALRAPDNIFSRSLWPTEISFKSFASVLSPAGNFVSSLRVSMILALAVTVLCISLAAMVAYALVRLSVPGSRLLLLTVLAAAMFPGVSILTPLFQLFSNWGWIGTYQSLVIPDTSFALPLAIWILTSFLRQVPWDLEDAASVDGCSRFQSIRLVMLPIIAPAIATTAILVFIQTWNEYLFANAMTVSPQFRPVTAAIALFASESEFQQPFARQMAAGVVVTIPVVLLVLLAQKRIATGLTAGSLKG